MSRFLSSVLSTSPHLVAPHGVPYIMRHVVYALLPAALWGVWNFGWGALCVIVVAILSCLGTEYLVRKDSLSDNTALLTGLLLGMVLPPGMPLWMVAVGGVASMLLGKWAFGGLGHNPFNPALVGRAFLQAAFPAAITTWMAPAHSMRFASLPSSTLTPPLLRPLLDGASGATPLARFKFDQVTTPWSDLFLGDTAGSLGETSAVLLALGGLYLARRGFLDWRIPTGMLLTVGIFSGILHYSGLGGMPPVAALCAGGVMIGAFFMATDMVTSPMAPLAVWAYACLIGVVTVSIRTWGGLPEGVMYAILLGNATAPLLDRMLRPRVLGVKK